MYKPTGIEIDVRHILREHGLRLVRAWGAATCDHWLVCELGGKRIVYSTLRGLVDVVDHYKPILLDCRLTALYN